MMGPYIVVAVGLPPERTRRSLPGRLAEGARHNC